VDGGSGGLSHPRFPSQKEGEVEIPKEQIIQLLQERGEGDQAGQAEQELPEQVDPEQDSDLLSRFGLDPQDVISKFGGGLLG
jgi:hypothetical protein